MQAVFFPGVSTLNENPYWSLSREALEALGCRFDYADEARFRLNWLWRNRKRVQILHFHFVQQFYAYENTQARPRWVLRFARNLLAARFLGYGIVYTAHNARPTYPLQPVWVDYLAHRLIIKLAQRVIVHCEQARNVLSQWYGRTTNVATVPHPSYFGVYPNTIDEESARKRLEIGKDDTAFLFFGGIRPNKGIETLIQAFRAQNNPDWKLLIAGNPGSNEKYTEEITNLAKQDPRIRIHPCFIADHDVQCFMNAVDVVVLPFRSILTSGSAMLALSFGKAIVAPAIGCLPEQIPPESRILFDPEDTEGLAKALKTCEGMDLRQMGGAGKNFAQGQTWARAATSTYDLYHSLLH